LKWSPHIGYVYFDVDSGEGEYQWAHCAKKLDSGNLFTEHRA
jgi:hypothetical protein